MLGTAVNIPNVRQINTPGVSPMIIPNPRKINTSGVSGVSPMITTNPALPSPIQINVPYSVNAFNQTSELISSKLTIYSRSGHIIQKYNPNTKTITLPKSVEIASIVVVGSDGSIIPFSYIPETNMGISLVDRSSGEKVDATVIKEDKTLKGKILSIDSDNVTLMGAGEISNIREYDRVSVAVTDDYTRPRVIINLGDLVNKINSFTLSYLLSSISWNCVGTALIDKNKNLMYLRLAGNIANNTESDITADTTLVSGDVYQYRRNQDARAESELYSPRAILAKTTPLSGKQSETNMLEDYMKYQVGNRIIRNKDVAELGVSSFPIIKLYVHRTNDNNTVRFGYRFTAPGFIPSCSLNVYSVDNNKTIDAYLGSNDVEQSQKNDEIDIILGESTLLQCKSEIIVTDVIVSDDETARSYDLKHPIKNDNNNQWHIITEDLKVEITNHNDTQSSLVLKHYIGDKKLVDMRCQAFKKRDNGFIEWYFQIPPKSSSEPRKEQFSCQIVTAMFY